MTRDADLLIRNVIPHGESKPRDLAMAGGRYVVITPGVTATTTLDGEGGLAIAGFVEPHIHLDKALIVDSVRHNVSGTLTEAIEIIWERKRAYEVAEMRNVRTRVIEAAVANGTLHIRTHVDVDTIGGLRPLEGVLQARERTRHLADIEIVAFPQEGILRNPGAEKLMWAAMEAGADIVGGMPFNEANPQDSARHIAIAFAIAKKFDAPIDMHVDETDDPGARTLEMLADQTIAHGWQGRVTAGHTCALAAYPDDYAAKVIDRVAAARIHMITNPATNLMLQGRLDRQPKRRGITRVQELLARGVNVSYGQDCVRDTFYPFGRNDPLEVALITAHAAHMSLPDKIEQVFAMQTANAAKLMALEHYGLQPGDRANLVIIPAKNAADAIRYQPPRRWVIRDGRVLAESRLTRTTHFSIPQTV